VLRFYNCITNEVASYILSVSLGRKTLSACTVNTTKLITGDINIDNQQ